MARKVDKFAGITEAEIISRYIKIKQQQYIQFNKRRVELQKAEEKEKAPIRARIERLLKKPHAALDKIDLKYQKLEKENWNHLCNKVS